MKNMKARPAKSSETQRVRINKSHYTQTIQKQYICMYNLYYPKFCANNMLWQNIQYIMAKIYNILWRNIQYIMAKIKEATIQLIYIQTDRRKAMKHHFLYYLERRAFIEYIQTGKPNAVWMYENTKQVTTCASI